MAIRSVVLDTETTGMPVTDGHRIIEIGCVELMGRRLTGRHFHVYLQPDRESDEGAIGVHGITNEFLVGKPRFAEVADEFFEFINGAQLIIHNAAFDVGFINNEFALMGATDRADITQHCSILDTLMMARERHPGQRNSLDALCKRYGVDNSGRELHGARGRVVNVGGAASALDPHTVDQMRNDTAHYDSPMPGKQPLPGRIKWLRP